MLSQQSEEEEKTMGSQIRRKPSFHFETERPKFESPTNRIENGPASDHRNQRLEGSIESQD
jgi:hypothetical protein